jgi:hypothetical protein
VATELAPEVVDREALVMAFPLQDTKRHYTAGDVMYLRPLGACLTATQAKLILTDSNGFFNVGVYAIQAPEFCRRQRQAVGGLVLVAVSDTHHFEPSAQPANLSPVGVPPMLTDRVAIEPAVLLQTTDDIPPLVQKPLQQGLRWIPGVEQHVLRATAQAVVGIAEQLQGQCGLRSAASPPEVRAHRDTQGP